MGAKVSEWMGGELAFVFGRRSYEDMLGAWDRMGGSYKDALNNAVNYVASRNAATRLEWPDSTLLLGDIPAAVTELNQGCELIGSLMAAARIDVFVRMTHPLNRRRPVPSITGARGSRRLRLERHHDHGRALATYEPARP
jgi:dihydrofolate reductase